MKTILQIDKNYQNHHKAYFLNKLIAKLIQNGNDYVLLQDDEPMVSLSHLKITKLLNELQKFPDDEVILYLDSFDTMVFASDKEIERKFLYTGLDVLYAAEAVCWPDESLKNNFKEGVYLNSGSILFKNKQYQKILQLIANIMKPQYKECDQYLHTLFFSISKLNVKSDLDKNCTIFQCLNSENLNNFEFIDGGKIYNKKTNTCPIVFHGNGTDGFQKINQLFNSDKKAIKSHRFSDDKSTIYFVLNETKSIKVSIYKQNNSLSYENTFLAEANAEYFVSAGQVGAYTFVISEANNDHKVLLNEKNNYTHDIMDFINQFKITGL